MLTSGVRALGQDDLDDALALCRRDPITNVFVSARLRESGLGAGASAFGLREGGHLTSLLWASANLVPVEASADDLQRYALRIRRARYRFSSIFGPADAVGTLWRLLAHSLPTPRSVRSNQPVLVANDILETSLGHPDVRLAQSRDLDHVVPAAAAMFTEEIGYAPYTGSDRYYRASVQRLISSQRTFVLTHTDGRVLFKADVGSLANEVAQIQGVWVHPAWRGKGLAVPCMIRTVELIRQTLAPTVALYVNDYNTPAIRTYASAGFHQVGIFATVIL